MRDVSDNQGRGGQVLALVFVMAVAMTSAHAQQVPPVHQSAILLKALAYDRNLKARASDGVDVLLLHDASTPESLAALKKTRGAFSALATKKLKGLPIRVHVHAYTSRDALLTSLVAHQVDTVYTCEGLSGDALDVLTTLTRSKKIASMTGARAHIKKGVALAVLLHDDKPRLVVNLKASLAEGLDLKSTLLRVAVVIR